MILAVQHAHVGAMLLLIALVAPNEPGATHGPSTLQRLLQVRDMRGCTAVHWAAYKGDMPALQLLDYFDADFTALDDEKMTALHRAAQGQQEEVIGLLLDRGVDPSVLDVHGRSCLDVAEQVAKTGRMARRLRRLLESKPSKDFEMGKILVRRSGAEEAEHFAKRAKRMAPAIFWLCCVSIACFEYLTELQSSAWTLTPNLAVAFELGVPLCLLLFLLAAQKDPGKVPARVKGNSAVEEILRAFQLPGDEVPEGVKRLCTATFVIKGLRTKYCKVTKACVKEFDHFCGWLGTAIGQGNHRLFMALVVVEVTVQLIHLAMCFAFLQNSVTGETYSAYAYNMATQYPMVVFVVMMHGFSSPGIAFLLVNHLYLAAVNLTTNEMINAYRYDHFWQVIDGRKVFRNPFNKGVLKNCLEFWWYRERDR